MCRLCDVNEAATSHTTSRRRFLSLAGGIAAGAGSRAAGVCQGYKATAKTAERDFAG